MSTSEPRKKTLEQFLRETFTEEFREEIARHYHQARIEGLECELEEANDKILELHGKVQENWERANKFNWVLKELGLYPDTDRERVVEEIIRLKHDKERAEIYAQDLKVSIRNALTEQFAFLLKVADLEIVSTEGAVK